MKIAVIGGGPAGLRAAEVAAERGAEVTIFDAKASVGRKFLVAGRGGLNLTKTEPAERFLSRYSGPETPPELWHSLISEFDGDALQHWARGVGVEIFTASTGRVYPRDLKAAPLLRRWVQRLREMGVKFVTHHRFTGLHAGPTWTLEFQTPTGPREQQTDAAILALGGGSWPETGSDGAWTSALETLGVSIHPLAPSNCGWELEWPITVSAKAEGSPLKSIAVRAGDLEVRGELLITKYGLEGGAIYALGTALRAMSEPEIAIDFKPTFSVAQLIAKLGTAPRDTLAEARQRWRLSDAALAIVAGRGPFPDAESLARETKNCILRLTRPRPIAEAISSAGGVRWSELDDSLMLRRAPGIFVAGEMIDWDAPTGGYLIHACLAMGTRAGASAARWIAAQA